LKIVTLFRSKNHSGFKLKAKAFPCTLAHGLRSWKWNWILSSITYATE